MVTKLRKIGGKDVRNAAGYSVPWPDLRDEDRARVGEIVDVLHAAYFLNLRRMLLQEIGGRVDG